MNINLKVRIKNKSFWITLIPALLLLIQAIAKMFGIILDLGEVGNNAIDVVNAVFGVLVILGIVNDPTTKGLSDSERALGYEKPYGDEK